MLPKPVGIACFSYCQQTNKIERTRHWKVGILLWLATATPTGIHPHSPHWKLTMLLNGCYGGFSLLCACAVFCPDIAHIGLYILLQNHPTQFGVCWLRCSVERTNKTSACCWQIQVLLGDDSDNNDDDVNSEDLSKMNTRACGTTCLSVGRRARRPSAACSCSLVGFFVFFIRAHNTQVSRRHRINDVVSGWWGRHYFGFRRCRRLLAKNNWKSVREVCSCSCYGCYCDCCWRQPYYTYNIISLYGNEQRTYNITTTTTVRCSPLKSSRNNAQFATFSIYIYIYSSHRWRWPRAHRYRSL